MYINQTEIIGNTILPTAQNHIPIDTANQVAGLQDIALILNHFDSILGIVSMTFFVVFCVWTLLFLFFSKEKTLSHYQELIVQQLVPILFIFAVAIFMYMNYSIDVFVSQLPFTTL